MLRLRWVRIKSYRSLAGDTELSFGRGAVFVLGRNASGKTTLLDLFANLIACRLAPFLDEDEPVDIEWELEWEEAEDRAPDVLRLHLAVEHGASPAPRVGDDLGGASVQGAMMGQQRPAARWTLEGELRSPTPQSGLALEGSAWVLGKWPEDQPWPPLHFSFAWDRQPDFDPLLELSTSGAKLPPSPFAPPSPFDSGFLMNLAGHLLWRRHREEGRPQIAFEHGIAIQRLARSLPHSLDRFDEALGVFNAIVDAPDRQGPVAEILYNHRAGLGIRFVPEPLRLRLSRFSEERDAIPATERDSNPPELSFTVNKKDIPPSSPDPFDQIVETLEADQLDVRPRLLEQEANGNVVWRGFDFYVRWPGGVKHRHTQLSFGQKRILAFLWYAAVFDKVPLLTDELTNGFHNAWARQLTDLLADRQVFHAIQNPLLLDKTGPGPVEELPGRFILCSADVGESGRREWRWRNPTAREAKRLRKAWDTDIQQLSQVLLSEGLW